MALFKSNSERVILHNNIFVEKVAPVEEGAYEGEEFEEDEEAFKAALEHEARMHNM